MNIAVDFDNFKKAKLRKEFAEFKKKSLTGAQGPIGPVGPQGEQGVQGEKGDDGRSVNVQDVVNNLLSSPEFLSKVKGSDGLDGHNGSDGVTTLLQTEIVKEVDDDELELKLQEYFHTAEFRDLVASKATVIGGSLGIAPSRVTNLETRVTNLENNPSGGLQYTLLTDVGTTTYTSADFIFGTNIIGVNAAGAVTIRLPDNLTTGTIITVNDESLNATANNITISTYKVN